jgi:drug/metabolite transporter (DMT)-like permease
MNRNVIYALLAAGLFGASTPIAKALGRDIPPVMLAGLLYLGSGLGLLLFRVARDRGWKRPGLLPAEWLWLLGANVSGGLVAPVLLLMGLRQTTGAAASLLLNLEAVLTAGLAWLIFKENAGGRVAFGMLAIVLGGVVLAWPNGSLGDAGGLGPVLIAAACLFWAIDNNLTRKVSAADSVFIAGSKGMAAGAVNLMLALLLGNALPPVGLVLSSMLLGLLGYGVSLLLFVLALRGLGAARTGAYFSTAPFIGASVAVLLFGESTTAVFWLAAALMAGGVWLHLTEHHEHLHTHELLEHSHSHVHDEHHQHEHEQGWDGVEPHTHWHRHEPLVHSHPHVPDIHHRHHH